MSAPHLEQLVRDVVKARAEAESDPTAAMWRARKCAEAICREIFVKEVGEPSANSLDQLIGALSKKGVLARRIAAPLVAIQAYGNYGAHPQPDSTKSTRSTLPRA